MIVVFNDQRQRFEAITSFLERALPKENRWRWDAAVKRWWAPSEDIARRLAAYAQGSAILRLQALSGEEQAALAASQAHDSDIAIPVPAGLAYLPYQRAGIAYALARPNTLFGDEMGVGKTIQAIGFVNAAAREEVVPIAAAHTTVETRPPSQARAGAVSRVLIVCPASLRLNWRAEWRRWHTGRLVPTLLDVWPRGGYRLLGEREGPGAGVRGKALIVSYDSVKKWHPMIAATAWDVLILDEVHLLKDERARRTRALLGGRYKSQSFEPVHARHILALTGTAIVNKPADLWPIVKLLAPEGMGKNRADFLQRYNDERRLDELHLRLRSQIMVRRLKADVLTELPAKRRQVVLLDVPDAEGILAAESRALSLQQAMVERTRAEIAGLPHQEQVLRLRQCRAIAMSEIARVRQETAIAKLPQAVEHIREVLGNVEKVVVFYHHRAVGARIVAEFGRIAVMVDGAVDPDHRKLAVDRFQQERGVRLFLGSIRAAGLGITLTAASTVIFLELDWTPAAMTQAEDRCHRIGQVNPVLAQHLVIDGSIDAKISRILIAKQAVADQILDGAAPGADSDIFAEVMRA